MLHVLITYHLTVFHTHSVSWGVLSGWSYVRGSYVHGEFCLGFAVIELVLFVTHLKDTLSALHGHKINPFLF